LLPQGIGSVPSEQVTLQSPTPAHCTWQAPWHSTVQLLTWVQVTTLPGPTRTPQVVTFEQA